MRDPERLGRENVRKKRKSGKRGRGKKKNDGKERRRRGALRS